MGMVNGHSLAGVVGRLLDGGTDLRRIHWHFKLRLFKTGAVGE
jgi:hypothetical protein